MSNTKSPEFMPWTTKDFSTSTSTQIARYIEERIQVYIEDNISGRELHELQTLDFESFSSVEYKKTTAQTKALRDFLRSRNLKQFHGHVCQMNTSMKSMKNIGQSIFLRSRPTLYIQIPQGPELKSTPPTVILLLIS
ncbi:hypothetical protein Golomagni_05352 [Golovinomyces magnicellulatus]|nr:hypothetical protein Golomagni_05352 [Golovinomyces magnicellulatus]